MFMCLKTDIYHAIHGGGEKSWIAINDYRIGMERFLHSLVYLYALWRVHLIKYCKICMQTVVVFALPDTYSSGLF